MGVAFFTAAVLAVLAGSAGLLILGIVLRFATKKRAQAGGRWAGRLRKLAGPAVVLGACGVIMPLIFFGFILIQCATPPDDFVETGIVIEEQGYQLEEFTADGVTYRRLCFEGPSEHGEAVFTYKEDGWYTASQWGNYYRVENGIGCDLVSDSYSGLFCPAEQYEQVAEAYENAREMDSVWRVNLKEEIEVSDELRAAFRAVQALKGGGRSMEKSEYDASRFLFIDEYSFDGVVSYDDFVLCYLDDGVFLLEFPDGQEGNRIVPIPEEHQSALLELGSSIPFP